MLINKNQREKDKRFRLKDLTNIHIVILMLFVSRKISMKSLVIFSIVKYNDIIHTLYI